MRIRLRFGRAATLGTLAAGWAALGPAAAEAQQGVSVGARGGLAVPVGRLADVTDPGPSAGVDLAYRLGRRVTLGLTGELDLLGGADLDGGGRAPDMRLWRYGAGLQADLLPSERWALLSGVSAGATTFHSDAFVGGSGGEETFRHTYLGAGTSLRLAYAVGSNVSTHVGAGLSWSPVRSEDTQALADLAPGLRTFSSTWSVPVTLGLTVRTGGRRTPVVAERAPERPPPPAAESGDRETAARELCRRAEAALRAGDYARARELLRRAQAEFPGTGCAREAAGRLEKVADLEAIGERIHFEYDRSRITDQAAEVLRRKAGVLARYPAAVIVIEGHCDERGSLEYNQALGLRRAESTKRFLASLGIDPARLKTVSYGKERPLVPGRDEATWARNRRAEFAPESLEAVLGAR